MKPDGEASALAEKVDMVVMITGLEDRAMITHALQSNNGMSDTVVNEFFDDPDKVRRHSRILDASRSY